jgi:hypothetical protein
VSDTKPRKLVIKSEEERLVYGEVYAPLHVDTDGECMTADEIKKAAHAFLASGKVSKIDIQHNQKESGCVVVESFLARKEDPDGFIEGSWVLGVYVPIEETWQAIKSGELNGFSFFGLAHRVPVTANVVVTRKMVGVTEKSTDDNFPEHEHPLDLSFNTDGRLLPGDTGYTMGHAHVVANATATKSEMGHSHRIQIIEER